MKKLSTKDLASKAILITMGQKKRFEKVAKGRRNCDTFEDMLDLYEGHIGNTKRGSGG